MTSNKITRFKFYDLLIKVFKTYLNIVIWSLNVSFYAEDLAAVPPRPHPATCRPALTPTSLPLVPAAPGSAAHIGPTAAAG